MDALAYQNAKRHVQTDGTEEAEARTRCNEGWRLARQRGSNNRSNASRPAAACTKTQLDMLHLCNTGILLEERHHTTVAVGHDRLIPESGGYMGIARRSAG